MNDFEQAFKEHKMAFLIGGAGLLVLLLILRSRGSAAADPVSQVLGYNAQQNQLNAQLSLQQQQIAAQQDATDQAAQAQEYQYQQAAQAQNYQTEAGLIANLYNTQQGAQVSEYTTGAEEDVANQQTAAELEATKTEYGSQDYLGALQAQLYSQGIQSQTQLEQEAQQYQHEQNQTILNEVGKAGLNHGTSSLENSLVGIIGAVEGEPSIGVAEANANASAAQASAYQNASIFNSIANLGKSTLSAVFS